MHAVPQTFNLPGPSTLTHQYLLDLVASVTYNPPSKAPVLPKHVAQLISKTGGLVWWPTLCPDEVDRRDIDDATTPGDWSFFGVAPDEIETYAIKYLRRYRTAYAVFYSPYLTNIK